MPITPEEQSRIDASEIRVKLIENGVLVKNGPRWFTYPNWAEAAKHIAARIEILEEERRAR